MHKKDSLTQNERKVLMHLYSDGRTTDAELARTLSLSQQAVYQIRTKLEEQDIIQGYQPRIDFKRLGIKLFYFVGLEILPELWNHSSETEINQKLLKTPFLFELYRIPASDISYLAIYGFKDLEEEERFTTKLESSLADQIKVVWSYTASANNILTLQPESFIQHAFKEKHKDVTASVKRIKQ
jgi:Lrp/AsnC family leucine-responsive transcriptional regulator